MRLKNFLFFFGLVILTGRCSHSEMLLPNPQSYYPLQVGDYRIYQVTSTSYNQLACTAQANDTTRIYFLKTLVTDSSKNAEGGFTYVIQRFTTPDTTLAWINLDVWSARVTANQVVINEGNISYVKIIFPLKDSTTWNGNLYNNLGAANYKLISHNVPFTMPNGKKFAISLTVSQSNVQNLVTKDVEVEVYAPPAGLVYKELSVFNYLTDGNCFGAKIIKNGFYYRQTLLRYGHQ
ncbi:MAG: hypothetical protein JST69_00805 [Bacteroidetes bacterium]|nr:hypothetical protein [Bacteroidota bacterium]